MADLKPEELDRAKLVFGIYDFDGSGKIDAFYLGDSIRAIGINPTNASIEKQGGTKKKGEKMLTLEEFLPIFSQIKKDKDFGTPEDFLECLKLYDKAENGTMMQAELAHVLMTLGERLTDPEINDIFKYTNVVEDDDGFMKYDPFIKALKAGPFPEENK
jgi:Ca2+-binding EF-hand superfamily protein